MACDCSSRINELTILNEKLKIQIQEKDKTVATLQRTVSTLERSSRAPSAAGFEDQVRYSAVRHTANYREKSAKGF